MSTSLRNLVPLLSSFRLLRLLAALPLLFPSLNSQPSTPNSAVPSLNSQPSTPNSPPAPSAARILAHTTILASDDFEGRAPGTPGEDKTVAYLSDEFKKLGLAPGNPDGAYTQDVPLVGITTRANLSFTVAGKPFDLALVNDYLANTTRVVDRIQIPNTDLVFVGYGVVAPEFDWDDYKGLDVRGKTVVMLVNDPPVTDASGQLDPTVFGGKAMTYYGRWTYKYEIAAAKGAAGCLIVHETVAASYPFAVLVGSNTRENFELATPDNNADHVAMDGWLTHDAAIRLFAAAGHDYEALKKAAARRDFQPVAFDAQVSFDITNDLRRVASKNVIAKLEGADPTLKNEYVIYTAHWDHLGRDPRLTGDQIYNGAGDNASGVAVLLEIARTFAALPSDQRPKRSLLFLSVTAEEKGLLGSRYYAQNPLYPLERTLAAINMDGANQFGRTTDMVTIGFGASTIDDIGIAVAKEQGRTMLPEKHPEFGSYYRSDHFEFAKVGVPAYYAESGTLFEGESPEFGEKLIENYIANDYHKPSDEVKPEWTFEGAAQDAAFLFEVGRRIANSDTWPTWRPGNEFKSRRDAMLK